MRRRDYIFCIVMLVLSVVLLAMNIIDLFTGGNVRWFDMGLCPIVAVAMILHLRRAHKKGNEQ